jgi:hypothetical protein
MCAACADKNAATPAAVENVDENAVLDTLATFDFTASLKKPDDTAMPTKIAKSVADADPDTIVGVGKAKTNNPSLSMSTAETRARVFINAQLEAMLAEQLKDYPTVSEKYLARIRTNLHLLDTRNMGTQPTPDGTWWALVVMPKKSVQKSVEAAIAAARAGDN